MVGRYAVVDRAGAVRNVIWADETLRLVGHDLIPCDRVDLGDTWDGSAFHRQAAPVVDQETLSGVARSLDLDDRVAALEAAVEQLRDAVGAR